MAVYGDYVWRLSVDGILWKKVVEKACPITREKATRFTKDLEAAVGPIGVVRGLLLDRIAANCLRHQALLDVQRETAPDLTIIAPDQRSALRTTESVGSSWFGNLLKYENLLNQGFHRDLILLETLQKADPYAEPLTSKKPAQSDRGLMEGQADSNVADRAAESSPSPVIYKVEREPVR